MVFCFAVISLGALARAQAQDATGAGDKPGPDVVHVPVSATLSSAPQIRVLTMGPGDHPFFKFGHNAILVGQGQGPNDDRAGVFNFGTFAFDDPALLPKFMAGRFHYWLSVSGLQETLWAYQQSNRVIQAQTLNLSPAALIKMQAALHDNAKPENREYLYDYFLDNCSTRVRDAVDRATGGQLRTALQAQPGRLTFRQHALRLTADIGWEYVAIHFALSGRNDRPLNLWQEAFIPEVLQAALASVHITDQWGQERKLVQQTETLFAANRTPPLEKPPGRFGYFLLTGLAFAGLLATLAGFGKRSRVARVIFSLALAGLGFLGGLLGVILILLWGVTNHQASFGNENIFLLPPWILLFVIHAHGMARGRPKATRRCLHLAVLSAGTALLAIVVKPLPWFVQDNVAFIAVFLPIWIAAAWGCRRLLRD